MTQVDVFELAVSARDALRARPDEDAEANAVNAVDAVSPTVADASTEWGEVFNAVDAVTAAATDSVQNPEYAVNAIDAISRAAAHGPRTATPTEMPDPGARCGVHNRFLTFAEQLHGRCSWCEWQARTGRSAR